MPSSTPGRTQSGFVLALTLWILAGIAVVVALLTLWARERVQDAVMDREAVEDAFATAATRHTLLYLLATRDLTRAGVPLRGLSDADRAVRSLGEFGALGDAPLGDELAMDDRAYAGLLQVRFALQDESGLFPLSWTYDRTLDEFLRQMGVDAGQVPRARDALRDYTDADSLARLHGAEAADYERKDLPPPPGRRLLAPPELGSGLGWDELPENVRETLQHTVSTEYAGARNMNTMPAELLPLWIPGCPEACRLFERQRGERPFINALELSARVGIRLPGDEALDYRFGPSDLVRLTIWARTGSAWRMHVRLTPHADRAGPWHVIAAYPLTRPSDEVLARPLDSVVFPDAQTRWGGPPVASAGRIAGSDRVGRTTR